MKIETRARINCLEWAGIFPQNFTSSTISNMSAILFRSDSKDDLIIIPKDVFICGGFELSFGYIPEELIEGKLNNYFLFFLPSFWHSIAEVLNRNHSEKCPRFRVVFQSSLEFNRMPLYKFLFPMALYFETQKEDKKWVLGRRAFVVVVLKIKIRLKRSQ